MQVLVHTDNHIQGDETLTAHVEASVENSLDRFGQQITRVEVFLGDENSRDKFGDDDKRCVMEARLAGLKPLAVHHHAASVKEAFDGAAEKLEMLLDKTLNRLHQHHGKHGGEVDAELFD